MLGDNKILDFANFQEIDGDHGNFDSHFEKRTAAGSIRCIANNDEKQ